MKLFLSLFLASATGAAYAAFESMQLSPDTQLIEYCSKNPTDPQCPQAEAANKTPESRPKTETIIYRESKIR